MPRAKNPNTITKAAYARQRRAKLGLGTVELSAETRAHLATIRARDGDATDRGAVARVVREAAERGGRDG